MVWKHTFASTPFVVLAKEYVPGVLVLQKEVDCFILCMGDVSQNCWVRNLKVLPVEQLDIYLIRNYERMWKYENQLFNNSYVHCSRRVLRMAEKVETYKFTHKKKKYKYLRNRIWKWEPQGWLDCSMQNEWQTICSRRFLLKFYDGSCVDNEKMW